MDSYDYLDGQIVLNEALNNPREYYMTDDTKIPESVYAAFDVDGDRYIMSLVETKDTGVYLFEVGRTGAKGGKTFWWRFHDKKDIIPVLATAMNFLQASTAWLQGRVKGVAIQFKMGASSQVRRAQQITQRLIKKAYVKMFDVIDVTQPPVTDKDKHYYQKMRYVFIGKKGVPPSKIFSGKTFKRYDVKGNQAPVEAVAELEPKKPKKITNTIKPSTKYSFGQHDVYTPIDSELLTDIENVKPIDDPSDVDGGDAPEQLALQSLSSLSMLEKVGAVKALPAFWDFVKDIEKNGYSPADIDDVELLIAMESEIGVEILKQLKLVPFTNAAKVQWRQIMRWIATNPTTDAAVDHIMSGQQKASELLASAYEIPKTNEIPKTIKSTVDPNELVATLPGSGATVEWNGAEYNEINSDLSAKLIMLENELNYEKEVSSLKALETVQKYTDSYYLDYNEELRQAIRALMTGDEISQSLLDAITSDEQGIQQMLTAFEQIKPLPESLWVYRGTYIPSEIKTDVVPGYDYIDPGFLSTSVSSSISFGSDRIRIFLPKGSKVIPVLSHSKHPHEREVILPPASVLKVIEVNAAPPQSRIGVQAVFVGSAFDSINEALKKQLTVAENSDTIMTLKRFISIMEQDNENRLDSQDQYDPEEKYGGIYDGDLAKLINDQIRSGQLKVDRPKQNQQQR